MVTPLRALRERWLSELQEAGAFAPAFELSELIKAATGWDEAAWRARLDTPPGVEQAAAIEALVVRRRAGEPLQYILGEWEFYGLPFYVGDGVLIPRGDTEALVDAALALLSRTEAPTPRIADLCSGTGCVAIALAKRVPGAEVCAVELSARAHEYLVQNIARNGAGNVTPLLRDALEEHAALRNLDLIVSNPPYIPTGELAELAPEVQREPMLALDGYADGLHFYRELARVCKERLVPGGWLAFECGDGQAPDVLEILLVNGYTEPGTRQDLEGFDRVAFARRGSL